MASKWPVVLVLTLGLVLFWLGDASPGLVVAPGLG